MRSVGVNAVPLRHSAHGDRVPPRGFDQDVLCLLSDHRVKAAHHAGQPHRLFRVGHNEILGRELALHAIQSLQGFAGLGAPNDEPATFKQIEIEHVRRLAALPQNVIGGVHCIADGPLVEQLQAAGNVRGRGLDGGAANFTRREPWTQFGLLNVDGDLGPALRRRQLRLDQPQRQIVERRGLASHAIMIHGVGAVGRDVHLEDGRLALARDPLDRDPRKGKFVRKSGVVDRNIDKVA